ncbi:hypothetical protein SBD_5327 [Streptomyces bottropensis ATCC 25435]|uniref:Uncharacterized protein n=1 Tax=Streptomyces bottropensis ATCC 25435 TaxID=1054862 RepID=M3FNV5_9ACTN|nr:hypothetical protein SBD_5327 [Streptomyces bottropensis ATCC 25435]
MPSTWPFPFHEVREVHEFVLERYATVPNIETAVLNCGRTPPGQRIGTGR